MAAASACASTECRSARPSRPRKCRFRGNLCPVSRGLGLARTGGVGEHTSGDIFLAFSTANRGIPADEYSDVSPLTVPLAMLSNAYITDLFDAVVEATEEAIVNALLAAETMTGRAGITVYRLEPARLVEIMDR